MIRNNSSLPYAKAILRLTKKEDIEGRLQQLIAVKEFLESNEKLSTFLSAPQVPLKDKSLAIKKEFSKKVDSFVMKFLLLLVEKRELWLLQDIVSNFYRLVKKNLNILEVKVITAVKINDALKEKIKSKLETVYQKEIEIEEKVDPSLIGGITLLIGTKMIDASVKGRLTQLKENLLSANLFASI